MDNTETRNITLPQGGVLEITMTEQFKVVVRSHFNLEHFDEIHDDHIRMFMFGAVKSAMDKAEREES